MPVSRKFKNKFFCLAFLALLFSFSGSKFANLVFSGERTELIVSNKPGDPLVTSLFTQRSKSFSLCSKEFEKFSFKNLLIFKNTNVEAQINTQNQLLLTYKEGLFSRNLKLISSSNAEKPLSIS